MTVSHIPLRSGRVIGAGHPCFIVAEAGNNHQGQLDIAIAMVEEAARAGADAIKFQKRDNAALLTADGLAAPYTGPNSFGPTYGQHRDALELSVVDMRTLKARTEALGLVFFTSAWDRNSLEAMYSLSPELLKICSADLVNVPYLRRCGQMGIPAVLSTGMSTYAQIDRAVAELRQYHEHIVLLHCNASYPCPDEEVSLPVMNALSARYKLPTGYSGHERGLGPSLAAVALGAVMVERHFTLDKTLRGTDHQVSLEPSELAQLVRMAREIERAVSHTEKSVFPGETQAAAKLRKSVVAARTLSAGTVLSEADITVKSPGTGLSPEHWDAIIGNTITCALTADSQITAEMLSTPLASAP